MYLNEHGDYLVNVSVSFGSQDNADVIEAAIFKNDNEIEKLAFRRKMSSGDLGVAALTGILNLSVGDFIDLRFRSNSADDVVEIEIVNVNISQVN